MKAKFEQEEDGLAPSTARLEAFSDGVIAIIVTLLIFEIKIPELHDASSVGVGSALWAIAPKFLGFVISFFTVCIFWVNHHYFMHALRRSDRSLLWYNNHLLFWLAIVPFVTAFVGDYPLQPMVIALYALVMMMSTVAFASMIHYVFFRGHLAGAHVSEGLKKQEFHRALFGAACYALAGVVAFIHPYISLAIFVVLPLYYVVPRLLSRTEVARHV